MIEQLGIALTLVSLISSSHTYCMTEVGCFRYNCQDYTRDSILLLRENGFEAYPALGYLYGMGNHAWVVVRINGTDYHIEPYSALVVEPTIRGCIDCDRGPYEFSRFGTVRGVN